jgi:hypothetical protein
MSRRAGLALGGWRLVSETSLAAARHNPREIVMDLVDIVLAGVVVGTLLGAAVYLTV